MFPSTFQFIFNLRRNLSSNLSLNTSSNTHRTTLFNLNFIRSITFNLSNLLSKSPPLSRRIPQMSSTTQHNPSQCYCCPLGIYYPGYALSNNASHKGRQQLRDTDEHDERAKASAIYFRYSVNTNNPIINLATAREHTLRAVCVVIRHITSADRSSHSPCIPARNYSPVILGWLCPDRLLDKPRTRSFQDLIVIYEHLTVFPPLLSCLLFSSALCFIPRPSVPTNRKPRTVNCSLSRDRWSPINYRIILSPIVLQFFEQKPKVHLETHTVIYESQNSRMQTST